MFCGGDSGKIVPPRSHFACSNEMYNVSYWRELCGGRKSAPAGRTEGVKREGNQGKILLCTAFIYAQKMNPDAGTVCVFGNKNESPLQKIQVTRVVFPKVMYPDELFARFKYLCNPA